PPPRGSPPAAYAPPPGTAPGGVRRDRLLAQFLLRHLSSAGPGAAETATQAGQAWGRYLIDSPPPFQQLTGQAALTRLTALLDELGFEPEPGPGTAMPAVIRLRHCPFLEL